MHYKFLWQQSLNYIEPSWNPNNNHLIIVRISPKSSVDFKIKWLDFWWIKIIIMGGIYLIITL